MLLVSIVAIFIGFSLLIFFNRFADGASNTTFTECPAIKNKIKRDLMNNVKDYRDEEFDTYYRQVIYSYMEHEYPIKFGNDARDCFCINYDRLNPTTLRTIDFTDIGGI
jgi:hypothetical protein